MLFRSSCLFERTLTAVCALPEHHPSFREYSTVYTVVCWHLQKEHPSVCPHSRSPQARLSPNFQFSCASDPWRLTPRRHRVPIAITQTLGLGQTPPEVPRVLTSHLTGRPQSKHFLYHHQATTQRAAVRCSTQLANSSACLDCT